MTQRTLADLFGVNVPAVSWHLKNIYASKELVREATVFKMETVQAEGSCKISRDVEYYNLDAVIAVGYRVNSAKAHQEYDKFRVMQDSEYVSNFDQEFARCLKGVSGGTGAQGSV
ncbi:MAG: virulence RhuM family protein [Candidatus Omnitrophica bacterium]|nr:virulence RhuM family protein [Candidatus Omnitrophota bacterium]